ncbi:hypothetical protein AB0M46_15190 [Dactylosporangium sp. NPDC051485]|uniref:hypothetical protein n=1 Tax=Dactylosporangium sp. NPDC051485 TaxID=3154846 RepID=UPI00342C0C4F
MTAAEASAAEASAAEVTVAEEAPPVVTTPAKRATAAKRATPARKTAARTAAEPARKTAAKKTAPAEKAAPEATKVTPAAEPPVDPPAKRATVKKAAPKKATATTAVAKVTNSDAVVESTPSVDVGESEARAFVEPEPIATVEAVESAVSENIRIQPAPIDPAFLPERLAVAAVERLGEGARRQVEWYRVTYPGVDGDAISRAITREFVWRARRQGFAAGFAGSAGLVVEAAALGWLQARLVLHVAAAYGHDPEDHRRAAELLVLQQIHATVETAEAAVRESRQAGRRTGAPRSVAPLARALGAGVARAFAARVARRIVPGAPAMLGSVTAARSTERLAARAVRYYRNLRG